MILTYCYRLLPSKAQHRALEAILEDQRQLYNAALEERVGAYRNAGITRTYVDQCKALTEWRRSDSEAASVPLCLQRWTLKQLDEAYRGFFRRVKGGGKPGFPRFRGKGRFDSFGFREFSGIGFDDGRLRFKGLSESIWASRRLPLSRTAASSRVSSRRDGPSAGLRKANRALDRKTRGSRSWRKARMALARCHAKTARARLDHLHKAGARLVRDYDVVAVEKLNVKSLARSALAKDVHDASWAKFISVLRYKAECAGTRLIEVDPYNTSQDCSGCGVNIPKALNERLHECPHCGLAIDRDLNAARNILHRAGVGPGLPRSEE